MRATHLPLWAVLVLLLSFPARFTGAAQSATNLVANGEFEVDANGDGVPDFWQAAGDRETEQQLGWDTGFSGGRSARLVCTRMGKDSPSAHAMICQVGQVGVQRGQWYRLSFRARGEGIRKGSVYVGLNNTKVWRSAGLDGGFYVTSEWQRQEWVFQATETLPAADSRLQFWFKSTGTLWLDEVELTAIAGGRQWFPQWPEVEGGNLIPNAGFECGACNWGSYNDEPGGWGNHLYRLVGEWLPTGGRDAGGCLKITLDPDTLPVFYFDYFDAVRRPVVRALAANLGWIGVTPGEVYTFSAYLRSEPDGVAVSLRVIEAEGAIRSTTCDIRGEWERYHLTFRPERPWVFVAVGPNMDDTWGEPVGLSVEPAPRRPVSVWLDHLVLVKGDRPGAIRPRQAVESFIETPVSGNIFTNPARGLTVKVRAATKEMPMSELEGRLVVTDFSDQVVYEAVHRVLLTNQVSGKVMRGVLDISKLLPNRQGFYRVAWMTAHGTNTLRCALMEPVGGSDGAIGMNHAYPWDFLMELAHLAGVRCWRDWSAKWQVVEPQPGVFDFRVPDEQIERVLRLGGQPLVLLPFPASWWATTYKGELARNDYESRRRLVAQAPKNVDDFGRYAAAVARHYQNRAKWYQVLNEPLYTSYSLPRADGYRMEDYLRLLESGYRGIKSANPGAVVVGGIGTGPDAGLTLEFVEKGGLRFADVLDLHLYEPPAPAEGYVESFAALAALMKNHGGPRPVWITEYGCYADDDPACVPPRSGDAAMNRSRWPSEQAAAEHLVKFTAVAFAHGTRKILLHAGTSAQINGPNEGGVFFEYGGQPRKMYAAVAALNRLLGTPDETLGVMVKDQLRAFVFRRGAQSVAVVWSQKPAQLAIPPGVQLWDVMGNRQDGAQAQVGQTPAYLTEDSASARGLRAALEALK